MAARPRQVRTILAVAVVGKLWVGRGVKPVAGDSAVDANSGN